MVGESDECYECGPGGTDLSVLIVTLQGHRDIGDEEPSQGGHVVVVEIGEALRYLVLNLLSTQLDVRTRGWLRAVTRVGRGSG
jgi:hypothetical protein